MVVLELDRGLNRVVANVMHQIQNDVRLIRFRKYVFVKTTTGGCRQFDGDFGILEKDRVITGGGVFLVMRKT